MARPKGIRIVRGFAYKLKNGSKTFATAASDPAKVLEALSDKQVDDLIKAGTIEAAIPVPARGPAANRPE
jgi:hypothetical protein